MAVEERVKKKAIFSGGSTGLSHENSLTRNDASGWAHGKHLGVWGLEPAPPDGQPRGGFA